ncbi:chaperonin 10-like protein [Piptocephalis cylindrospora]|uniref:Chaperonin 10-like protein n=1 Tax=Piptocephalis cylindrospora TaxID=1907219 RepID=A0A4P9Y1C6_9FUNG|nr:chaperonin 10-like protein [Piptocephalis cylindrospora]|eukprot:RKP12575.1 chaperonin 10-like protein [Piptocephalis cylindrospora]
MSSLPTTQKAIQITENGDSSVLKLRDVPVPTTPGPNQLLVRNQMSGVNFIDTYHRTGLYPVDLPLILGREGAGQVVGIGEGVKGFSLGDRVAYAGVGSYAQYSLVPTMTTIKLPDTVKADVGAASFLQGLTALSLTRLAYTVRPGDWVLIQAAAGGTGLLLCQLCKLAGATVIGTTSTEEKAVLAKKAGADHIIYYS